MLSNYSNDHKNILNEPFLPKLKLSFNVSSDHIWELFLWPSFLNTNKSYHNSSFATIHHKHRSFHDVSSHAQLFLMSLIKKSLKPELVARTGEHVLSWYSLIAVQNCTDPICDEVAWMRKIFCDVEPVRNILQPKNI